MSLRLSLTVVVLLVCLVYFLFLRLAGGSPSRPGGSGGSTYDGLNNNDGSFHDDQCSNDSDSGDSGGDGDGDGGGGD